MKPIKPLITSIRELLAKWSEDDDSDEFRTFTSGDVFDELVKEHPEINRKYLDTVIVRLNARGEIVQIGYKHTSGVKKSFLFRVDRHSLMHMLRNEDEVRARQVEAANRLEACLRAMKSYEGMPA